MPTATNSPIKGEHLIAVGDVADCKTDAHQKTAALVTDLPGTIAILGDTVYETATKAAFENCFDPWWGKHKSRIRPAAGNHDYGNGRAEGYYSYFADAAGPRNKGYYSYDLGVWHIVVLNSNCVQVSCAAGDAQQLWLQNDLGDNDANCTLAYWHHPRFTSGLHGPTQAVAPLYQTLYDHDVDVALAGHDHHYERFEPLNAQGLPDALSGIRNFIVGTGGARLYPAFNAQPGTETNNATTFGLLDLTLGEGEYAWRFVAAEGSFSDSGSGTCH